MNDDMMQVLGWSIQNRNKSFIIMHVMLNVDNI